MKPKDAPATLADIAQQVGVSVASVSQALAGKGRLRAETRQRIIQAAAEMGYIPDESARNLANRRASQLAYPVVLRHHSQPRPVWYSNTDELVEYVRLEAQQRREEGCDVSALDPDLSRALGGTLSQRQVLRVYRTLERLAPSPSFAYTEPDSLDLIREARPPGPRCRPMAIALPELHDRLLGAWQGRCSGCLLGKPIESGWPRDKVRRYLELADAYPLRDYVPLLVPLPKEFDLNPCWQGTVLGQIDGMVRDDDIDYTILNLSLLERHGLQFSTEDVGTAWLSQLPYQLLCTAERVAYRNLVQNILPPDSATFHNPCREFVGARIRADVFGYVTPGNPQLAAELAYRDAALSHTRNGIYTAMQTAAMLSWAYVSNDMREIIEVGLSEIPTTSRATALTREVLACHTQGRNWEATHARMMQDYGGYHAVHALNNMAVTLLALLYGEGDLERSITIAVMCGLDTDSNGATVGSIVGLLNGAGQLPAKWVNVLQDCLETALAKCPTRRISGLAGRTTKVAQSVLAGREWMEG